MNNLKTIKIKISSELLVDLYPCKFVPWSIYKYFKILYQKSGPKLKTSNRFTGKLHSGHLEGI